MHSICVSIYPQLKMLNMGHKFVFNFEMRRIGAESVRLASKLGCVSLGLSYQVCL